MSNLLSAGVYRLLRSKVVYVCLAAMFLLEIFFLQGATSHRIYWNEGLESSYFLYTLLLPLAAAEEALRTGNRELLGKTMPAKGLTLLRAEYGFPLFGRAERE